MRHFEFQGIGFDIDGNDAKTDVKLACGPTEPDLIHLEFTVAFPERKFPEKISVRFKMPCIDVFSAWNPTCRFSRLLSPNWAPVTSESRAARSAPIQTLIGKSNRNRLTLAVSDASTPMNIKMGFCEEDGCIDCAVEFFTKMTARKDDYRAVIRIDKRNVAFYDSISEVRKWWTAEGKYDHAYVPENARLPLYSIWYSFHQEIDVDQIVEQCRLAKELGCESVIVDDGWQTDNSARGYAYCRDWEVCREKVPDMRGFVERVHGLGMKFILWYSVPFVGRYSKAWDRFEGKFLEEQTKKNIRVLDPRFKEVRDYLTDLYERAVLEWDLDGFKLDFIDSFLLTPQSPFDPNDGRDFDSLEDAIEELLRQALAKVRAIKPDACIEFRQGYIGPLMQKYGNMLRVGDCPADALSNRVGSIDLRLTSGETAVHSDMLIWNSGDDVESAAMQLIAVLYCVPQISVRIDALPESHRKMLKFYLKFWLDHRDVLLCGRLRVFAPEANYSMAIAEKDGKMIATAYTNPVIELEDLDKDTDTDTNKDMNTNMGTNTDPHPGPHEIIFINGTGGTNLFIRGADHFDAGTYEILDCMGTRITEEPMEPGKGVRTFEVPVSGMVIIRRSQKDSDSLG